MVIILLYLKNMLVMAQSQEIDFIQVMHCQYAKGPIPDGSALEFQKNKFSKYFSFFFLGEFLGIVTFTFVSKFDVAIHSNLNKNSIKFSRQILSRIIDYCFNILKVDRISVCIPIFCSKLINLLKKFGFLLEGVKFNAARYNGENHDFIHMGLLNKWQTQ